MRPGPPAPLRASVAESGIVSPTSPTPGQIERLRAVPEFKNSPTGFILPDRALDYFCRKYVINLSRHVDLSVATLLDCGCHEGWNVLAFLLAGGRRAIGVDTNKAALGVARQFARILEVEDRALFCQASVTQLPLGDQSVDVVCCIETLEHLYGAADQALAEIARVARRLVLLTTPNLIFPVVAHDTRLPFAHWLPPRWRRPYARAFGRSEEDEGNLFVTPCQVVRGLHGFRLVSRFLGFASFAEYVHFFPHYLPYMGSGRERDLPRVQRWFYAAVHAIFGRASFYVLPSLTGIFERRESSGPPV